MKKRAQFYLIAVVIFTAVIIGFFTLSNTYQKKLLFDIENNQQEIETEVQKIMEYGIYNGLTNKEIIEKINEFLRDYVSSHPNIDFYFIYGTKDNLKIYGANNRKIQINSSDNLIDLNSPNGTYFSKAMNVSENILKIKIDNKDYSYNLDEMNFYYIIIYEKNGEIILLAKTNNLLKDSPSNKEHLNCNTLTKDDCKNNKLCKWSPQGCINK